MHGTRDTRLRPAPGSRQQRAIPVLLLFVIIHRLRGRTSITPLSRKQRQVDLSIIFLAAAIPLLGAEWVLLFLHRNSLLLFALSVTATLCIVLSFFFALIGRGVGRYAMLVAHLLLLLLIADVGTWATVVTYERRGEPFFSMSGHSA